MRLPFELSNNQIEEDARVKFIYTAPELHQNIEISLDGENTSIDAILDAFQRFLGALGVAIPPNVGIGFIDLEEDSEKEEGEEVSFEADSEEDKPSPPKKKKRRKQSEEEEDGE